MNYNANKMLYFIYIRVSREGQDLNKILEECENYCKQYKYEITQTISVVCSSSKSKEQRRIIELLSVIKNGDTIITTELSRLGRNVDENRELFLEFKRKNIKVKFTRSSHDILEHKMFQGIFFEVFSLFTEIERNMIRERTKAALNSLKEKGIQLGRPKMNTYKNPKLDSNKDTIIKMLNLGVPQSKIARKFNVDIRTFYKFVNYHKLITNIKNSV